MTIKINGTELTLQPTEHRWVQKTPLGTTGEGQQFYAPVRQYEMRWQLIPMSDFNQLQGFINSIGTTGTAVVELPQYGASTYTFFAYSGCVLDELSIGYFFQEHAQEVVLLVRNIRT